MASAVQPCGEPVGAVWRKSSYSGAGNDCVEVAPTGDGAAIRDSKAVRPGALRLSAAGWRSLLDAVCRGELDR